MKFLFKWWKHFVSEHREQESEILREEISSNQPAKGTIYHVAITMVIFSCVRIWHIIFMCEIQDILFWGKNSPGIALVVIINQNYFIQAL